MLFFLFSLPSFLPLSLPIGRGSSGYENYFRVSSTERSLKNTGLDHPKLLLLGITSLRFAGKITGRKNCEW
jgi:hypothetical protein